MTMASGEGLSRHNSRTVLLAMLLAGAVLRLWGQQWDEGHHLHPDERFISMVEEKLAWPGSVREYLDSSRSPLDPYNRGDTSFVYGTFPMFLSKAIGSLLGRKGYDGTYLIGRDLSALFDLVSVWLVYLMARRFGGRATALLAAGLMAFCALGIQLSHFWGVDTFLTTFSCLALFGAIRQAQGRSGVLADAATGAAVGLAVACKITALALLAPVGLAILVAALAGGLPRDRRSIGGALARIAGRLAVVLVAAAIVTRIALPYAFLGPGLLSFRLDPRYVRDIRNLTALSKSVASFPPAFQWAGRTLLFPLKNFVLWGAGLFFGVAALLSLFWTALAIGRRKLLAALPLLAHAVFLLLYHGLTTVKSMRYLYPAYPALAVLTALFLSAMSRRFSQTPSWRGRLLRASPAVVLSATFLWSLAFTSIYRRPHPRIAASLWIYENAPPGARIANEAWDDGLPLGMPDRNPSIYSGLTLNLFDPDSPQKADLLLKTLREADWIAVTSNRVYANLTRLPDVFPLSSAYYGALFEERLGFQRAADFSSYPSLGPLRFPDDRAEEQFTVYDHPRVLLFRKTADFSEARARGILMAAIPKTPLTIGEWERLPRSSRRVTASLLPPRGREVAKFGASGRGGSELRVGSFAAALLFYAAVLLVGVLALPLTYRLFPRFEDRGAGFARILGLALATYALSLAVHWRVLRNGRGVAFLVVVLLAAGSAALFWARRREILAFCRERRRLLAAGEVAFAAGFLLFAGLRALNPEIAWGEKPMDFSILNILVRTPTLPASDPWFSGAPLGYYTFGHEIVAFLTLLTGLSTRYTFNLAFGLLGGLTAQGAFSLLRNWTGNLRAGVAGAAFVSVLGNLSGLREWLTVRRPQHLPLDWHYFWATSRVVKDTINEYPFWSLTFADLHAHVLAMPLLLFVVACALHCLRVHADPGAPLRERILSSLLLGFAAAAEALTNAWDIPLLAGLLLLTALAVAFAPGRVSISSGVRAAFSLAASILAAVLFVLPLWVRGGGPPGVGRNGEPGARGVEILTLFGFFFFLALAWWLVSAHRRLVEAGWTRLPAALLILLAGAALAALGFLAPSVFCVAAIVLFLYAVIRMAEAPEDRLAFGLIATGFFLVAFAQRFYISDRMNTFFKLYFETWLVLAVGTAALLFSSRTRRGALGQWPWPARGIFFLLLLACLFTTATSARGALLQTRPTYRGPASPSLDGLRYLETANPGEYQAVVWLRRTIKGTPVVLEAQGPSYQDFGRISMNTGFPTVLGWDYHVRQRGNPEAEIEARKKVVEQIYASPNAEAVERLLRQYHVGYVYVGWLERKTYPAAGLKKFDTAKDLFALAYENRETKIYRVLGGETQDIAVAKVTRETLPAAATATGSARDEPEESPAIAESAPADQAPYSGMKEPRDAAVDGRGRLWVADFGNSRLRVFDRNGGYLGGWGGRGNGTFGLREPCGVAIAGDDLYIADTWNGRIQHFTLGGQWKATAAGLYGPRGVAVAPDGSVWVTDTGNNRLVVYDAALNLIQSIGKKGSGPGDFASPVGIAASLSGSIAVADTANQRISRLNASGGFQASFPFPGWPGGNVEPHVEFDRDESLYVTDPASNVVLQLEPSGKVRSRWTEDGNGKRFSKPTGIALDGKARILYVINSGNNTVSTISLPRAR